LEIFLPQTKNKQANSSFRLNGLLVRLSNLLGSAITIRTRLFIVSIATVVITMAVFITISSFVGIRYIEQQTFDKLESIAILKTGELNNWTSGLRSDLATVIIGDDVNGYAYELLRPSGDPEKLATAYKEMSVRFTEILKSTKRLDEIFLMNMDRQVVLSTDQWREGGYGTSESNIYFHEALIGEYLHPPSYALSVGGIAIIVARPITNEEGTPIGIIVGYASQETLNEILSERTGLGDTGEAYLITNSNIMLSEPRFPEQRWHNIYYVFSEGALIAINEQRNGSGIYNNYRGERVFGVYHWIPELEVALLAEQYEAEIMAPTFRILLINITVALGIAFLAGIFSIILARTITEPLASLVKTVGRVTSGDLSQIASVSRQDEIGVLAEAFNRMTQRLRGLIINLEEQVKERNASIQLQGLQLQLSTEVSREITSNIELDKLLSRIVELIQEAFGYYHVAIYIADAQCQNLIFMAGTGEVSERWRVMKKSLVIGGASLNGDAALSRVSVVSNDVLSDARYQSEDVLPDTLSEVVAPLRIGNQLLGTLDVQSSVKDAFDVEHIRIIESLGNQVAIAIENARLYDRIRLLATLEERQRLARELHDSVTQSLYGLVLFSGAGMMTLKNNDNASTQEYMEKIGKTANDALKEMRLLLYQLRSSEKEWLGLTEALQNRLESVEDRLGIETSLMVEDDLFLDTHVEKCLYGIAQEALNNALKHSTARVVSVRVYADHDSAVIEVFDNGTGFDRVVEGSHGGMGLIGMNERALKVGGSLQIDSEINHGTRVTARIPKECTKWIGWTPEMSDE
jgi:nitrate/nitrite-specific signal transduction histidine kinase